MWNKNARIITAVFLIAAVLLALSLVFTHNHYSDLGRRFDPSCPVCQMLLGFVLFLAICPTFSLFPRFLSVLQPVCFAVDPDDFSRLGNPRGPPLV
ncbi:MAG: hypothetical protein GX444_18645 [Myxococcales bacterium]|nr:hypothetical protein [Myxococcales bacterium]